MRVAPERTRPRGAERKSPASRSRDAAAASEDRSPWVRMFFTLLPVPDMLYKRHAKLELAAPRDVVVKATFFKTFMDKKYNYDYPQTFFIIHKNSLYDGGARGEDVVAGM
jgi:hypothetical protein